MGLPQRSEAVGPSGTNFVMIKWEERLLIQQALCICGQRILGRGLWQPFPGIRTSAVNRMRKTSHLNALEGP
jgi:hypothetical protein